MYVTGEEISQMDDCVALVRHLSETRFRGNPILADYTAQLRDLFNALQDDLCALELTALPLEVRRRIGWNVADDGD